MGWLTTLYILITPVLKANKVLGRPKRRLLVAVSLSFGGPRGAGPSRRREEAASHWGYPREGLRLSEVPLSLQLIRPFSFFIHTRAQPSRARRTISLYHAGTLTSKFSTFRTARIALPAPTLHALQLILSSVIATRPFCLLVPMQIIGRCRRRLLYGFYCQRTADDGMGLRLKVQPSADKL